ncbi:unnamed protein product [Polarella glacialis]|uniref:SURP motif domain-containing protein n=1 Tax=Polarella glacialis TaxID=89957 RepID=A0A813GLH3_POLGL|nr:unnamed protein product [Polarella glacialis]
MLAAMAAALAPDLRKRIEIMADHIARNGVDFESTVKQKNASNPQFAFLYSGEGSEYYQQVLFAHRTPVVPPPAPVPAPVPAQVPIPAYAASGGSLATLLRGGQVEVFPSSAAAPVAAPPSAPVMMDVAVSQEVLRRWKEPQVLALTPEVERQLAGVLGSLEPATKKEEERKEASLPPGSHRAAFPARAASACAGGPAELVVSSTRRRRSMASRDAIRNGRLWIECNSVPRLAAHWQCVLCAVFLLARFLQLFLRCWFSGQSKRSWHTYTLNALGPHIAGHVMRRVVFLSICAHRPRAQSRDLVE